MKNWQALWKLPYEFWLNYLRRLPKKSWYKFLYKFWSDNLKSPAICLFDQLILMIIISNYYAYTILEKFIIQCHYLNEIS